MDCNFNQMNFECIIDMYNNEHHINIVARFVHRLYYLNFKYILNLFCVLWLNILLN